METNKDGQYTQVICHGAMYMVVQVTDGRVQYWDGRKRQFGSFYLRSTYRSSRLAENIRATITASTPSNDMNHTFHGVIRDTDA